MNLIESQLDRLVGPSHHFGGLGVGNLASQQHAGHVSNPAAAALQGLDKMRRVASAGVPQIVLPPQSRPDLDFLRSIGFQGTDADVLKRAAECDLGLLSAASSCSAMWTANAATVTPGVDSEDEITRVTIANLDASVHRAIEPEQTWDDLTNVLPPQCRVFRPIPGGAAMRDEGAANHMRLGTRAASAGINIFVYGDGDPMPEQHWPRQSRRASEAVARLHELTPENTFFLKQHPAAIDAGAFHNDVVAISHHNLMIHHELAFHEDDAVFDRISERFHELCGVELIRVVVSDAELSLEDAVRTYLFNSQIIASSSDRNGPPTIIATSQVADHAGAKGLVERCCADGIFSEVQFVELDQSMWGGGGPACLRLRVPLPESQLESFNAGSRWSAELDGKLREVINRRYATRLKIEELANVESYRDGEAAQKEIESLLRGPGGRRAS